MRGHLPRVSHTHTHPRGPGWAQMGRVEGESSRKLKPHPVSITIMKQALCGIPKVPRAPIWHGLMEAPVLMVGAQA